MELEAFLDNGDHYFVFLYRGGYQDSFLRVVDAQEFLLEKWLELLGLLRCAYEFA